MAMITGFLIAYAAFTLPVVGYIGYKVWARMAHPERDAAKPSGSMLVISAMREVRDQLVAWLVVIENRQKVSAQDHQAMLQATKAIAQSLLDIKVAAESFSKAPSPEKSINDFVHSLEYARDRFARTATQKKVVEAIIINVKTTHGTESK